MEFQDFPPEILLHIVSFLPSTKDINSFGQTCFLHNSLVVENDMRLVRKEYGFLPRNKGIEKIGVFHISPRGVLHGFSCTSFDGNITTVNYKNGVRDGFEMTVFEDGYVESGNYKDGKRKGIWRCDSEGFREDWNGSSYRVYHYEDGSSYSHSKGGDGDAIVVPTDDANFELQYRETMMREDFHCHNTELQYCAGFIKHIHDKKKGTLRSEGGHLFHCCKEHQGDMPNDLLYSESPNGLLITR